MNIGIIVYSQTGNTLSITEKLKEKLQGAGHTVTLEQVEPQGEVNPGTKHVEFKNRPDPAPYDGVIFASPVQAFSLAAAMKAYLKDIGSLEGKRVACFVTKQLPFRWTGANQALGFMQKSCESKGASLLGANVIFWSAKDREEKVATLLDRLKELFSR